METDDDEFLAQIQKLIETNPNINEEEFLKEKILEARLLAQCKSFVNHSFQLFCFRSSSENNLSSIS